MSIRWNVCLDFTLKECNLSGARLSVANRHSSWTRYEVRPRRGPATTN